MSLYRYDVTWMIPDRPPAQPIEVPDGKTHAEVWVERSRELASCFREESISCMAPNALDAVTQTQYQAETSFIASYGPSVERRPYVKTCWCRGEATATVYHYTPPEGCGMTDDELKAIKARAEAATPEPWEHAELVDEGEPNREVIVAGARGALFVVVQQPNLLQQCDDAGFVAHARTDVPALVEEVERWRLSDDDRDDLATALGIYSDHCYTLAKRALSSGQEDESKLYYAGGERVQALALRLLGRPA